MPSPRVLLATDVLSTRVRELGALITRDYEGGEPVLVCTLKGGFVFAADLARAIDLPVRIEFLRGRSYGDGTESSGMVHVTQEPDMLLVGRDIILIEDIVDTGRTSSRLLDVLRAHRPASLKVCTLLDKPSRRVVPVTVDYTGFVIDDVFVVGYGLDLGGLWRNLPYVGVMDGNS